MSVASRIPLRAVDDILAAVLGKSVTVTGASEMDLYVPSLRGLITDADELVGVIGGNREFVRTAGTALISKPATPDEANNGETQDDESREADVDDDEMIESYGEVATVLARVVNDFGDEHVRIDPRATHSNDSLGLIIGAAERCLFTLDVEGYGTGVAGIWTC